MRDRYLLGKWVAFEGVVYDEFDENMHVIPQQQMLDHIDSLRVEGQRLTLVESYDFGATAPSCYLIALVDSYGIVYIIDGFYKPAASGEDTGIAWQANQIDKLRKQYALQEIHNTSIEPEVYADPSIFRVNNVNALRGVSIAQMFSDHGIYMRRGNNERMNGVIKVKQYLTVEELLLNPFTSAYGCPKLFVSDHLGWFRDEITTWRWARDRTDNAIDKMIDGNDHAMDALRYLVTDRPKPGFMLRKRRQPLTPKLRLWHETDIAETDRRTHRHML